MSDETKVPPGWVRLHNEGTGHAHVAPWSAWRYQITPCGAVLAWHSGLTEGRLIDVMESPDEVAELIAAAEAAERRANVLPLMAAVLGVAVFEDCDGVTMQLFPRSDATRAAAAILDAIEREREGSDD